MSRRSALAIEWAAAIIFGLSVLTIWLVLGADMWIVVAAGIATGIAERLLMLVVDRRIVEEAAVPRGR